MNRHPLHFDREYARHTEFGQPIVNSALTLAVVTGMSVADVSQQAIANLGWTDIRMPAPVFNGDTLYAESEVLEKRESRSRPTQGIVTIATRAYKADGTLVMEFKRTMLIPKRGHSIEDRIEAARSGDGVRAGAGVADDRDAHGCSVRLLPGRSTSLLEPADLPYIRIQYVSRVRSAQEAYDHRGRGGLRRPASGRGPASHQPVHQ